MATPKKAAPKKATAAKTTATKAVAKKVVKKELTPQQKAWQTRRANATKVDSKTGTAKATTPAKVEDSGRKRER